MMKWCPRVLHENMMTTSQWRSGMTLQCLWAQLNRLESMGLLPVDSQLHFYLCADADKEAN